MRRHPRQAEPGVGAGWFRELLCLPWARSQAYYGRDMGVAQVPDADAPKPLAQKLWRPCLWESRWGENRIQVRPSSLESVRKGAL